MSDFRNIYKADFNRLVVEENESNITFVLQAIKPSRVDLSNLKLLEKRKQENKKIRQQSRSSSSSSEF